MKNKYSWPLNTGLNCLGLLTHRFFSINTLENVRGIYDNLKKHFLFSIIYVTYKICANWLLTLLVRFLVNSKLLVVKFWGKSKVIHRFFNWMGVSTPTPRVVQGPPYPSWPRLLQITAVNKILVIIPLDLFFYTHY